MSGWIIQGARGEGKSLCAVAKMREYLRRGCPVATNLNLYLEHLVPDTNSALVYRLPDWPRSVDFEALPPAYDPAYKDEDKNGLLVLDEMALWCNCRLWKDADRQKIIEWLLLSRKDHWDLILLCQDHEMIDNQVKTTTCEHLVQASRTDKQKVPFLAPFLQFLGFSPFKPKVHKYDVYYGFSGLDVPVDHWTVRGTDLYEAYDTNQKFRPGLELVGKKYVDMRAIFTYLPANYLSKRVYLDRLQIQINQLIDLKPLALTQHEDSSMARRIQPDKSASQLKLAFLAFLFLAFTGWAFWKFNHKPDANAAAPVVASVSSSPVVVSSASPAVSVSSSLGQMPTVNQLKGGVFDALMSQYRPRLAMSLVSDSRGSNGIVEFYDGGKLVDRLTFTDIRDLGASVVIQQSGVAIITAAKSYFVRPWPLVDKTEDVSQVKGIVKS